MKKIIGLLLNVINVFSMKKIKEKQQDEFVIPKVAKETDNKDYFEDCGDGFAIVKRDMEVTLTWGNYIVDKGKELNEYRQDIINKPYYIIIAMISIGIDINNKKNIN